MLWTSVGTNMYRIIITSVSVEADVEAGVATELRQQLDEVVALHHARERVCLNKSIMIINR